MRSFTKIVASAFAVVVVALAAPAYAAEKCGTMKYFKKSGKMALAVQNFCIDNGAISRPISIGDIEEYDPQKKISRISMIPVQGKILGIKIEYVWGSKQAEYFVFALPKKARNGKVQVQYMHTLAGLESKSKWQKLGTAELKF